ncbi:MAG: SDR family oxidoreductase [Nanoarchaeota archaeon]
MAEVVLITGCSSGIGRTTALYLANRDYTVYATARKQEDLKSIVEDSKKIGKQIYGAQLDVNDVTTCRKVVSAIVKKEGKIDILINNAGFGQMGPLEDLTDKQIRDQMETNFFASVRMMQLVIPPMRNQRKGKIVNISSVGGRIAFPLASIYNASKFALEGLSESISGELKQFNIDVILIEPGYVKTRFAETAEKKIEGMNTGKESPYHSMITHWRNMYNKMEGNAGKPEDVAEVIFKSITDENPKLRYAGNANARQTLFLKKMLPESIFNNEVLRRAGVKK